jgi:ornithine cyclodeaminase
MLILNKADLEKTIDHLELMDTIVEALRNLEASKMIMPQRMHMDFGQNTLLLMPCVGPEYFSTKLVSMFPGNSEKGLPPIFGSVVLNDGQTGKPLAMIEGSMLTGLRTGAVGGIGARYTTRDDIKSIGLVGTGTQGFYQLQFILRERPVKSVYLFNNDPKYYDEFRSKISNDFPEVKFKIAESPKDLVQNADLIITATNSSTPVLPDEPGLFESKHIVAVGSYKPGMQEIPGEAFKSAGQIIVDTEHAAHESGDVINPVKNGFVTQDQIIPISKVVTEKAAISKTGTTIFKSVGMALFDLAAAGYFYQKALEQGLGTQVEF